MGRRSYKDTMQDAFAKAIIDVACEKLAPETGKLIPELQERLARRAAELGILVQAAAWEGVAQYLIYLGHALGEISENSVSDNAGGDPDAE